MSYNDKGFEQQHFQIVDTVGLAEQYAFCAPEKDTYDADNEPNKEKLLVKGQEGHRDSNIDKYPVSNRKVETPV